MFDLDAVKDTATIESEGRRVEILGADRKPLIRPDGNRAKMQIFGTYSKQFIDKQNEIAIRNRRNTKRLTDEELEARNDADNREQWGVCVGEWDLLIGGKRAEPEVVFVRRPEVYAQVIEEARDHVSFSQAASLN